MGVDRPQPTFSVCFGAPFMPLRPTRYADMLAARLRKHGSDCWLVNTGWTGGPCGVGHRMSISLTRELLACALSGRLATAGFAPHPVFKVLVPHHCDCAADEVLDPRASWADKEAYDRSAGTLARMFRENFAQYEPHVAPEVLAAGPDPVPADRGPKTAARI